MINRFKDFVITDIVSGAGHSCAIDQQDTLYSWGASADFQTGIYVKPSQVAG
jgi:alpha-tubulin suppressor-like RCC1 family protein